MNKPAKINTIFMFIALSSIISAPTYAHPPRYVSLADAQKVVDTFKRSDGDPSGTGKYYNISIKKNFYIVSIGYADTLGFEYYAVDRRTGDLWEANFCQKDSSQKLLPLQKRIRTSLGITEAMYKELRKPGPMCGQSGSKIHEAYNSLVAPDGDPSWPQDIKDTVSGVRSRLAKRLNSGC